MTYRSRGGETVDAIGDIDFRVDARELLCIVGPSGCGKTSLLKVLSGLMRPTEGTARFAGEPIVGPPDGLALVFQEYSRSLLPWMSVVRNVALPLRAGGVGRNERRAAAEAALDAVDLAGFGDRYPWELSGGMQQRVAIARAVACRPRLLLMDEPFASVDAQTRADLEDLVLRVHAELEVPTVFVTHDIDEAVYLADRVLVLSRRPSVTRTTVPINLDRPRDQVETRHDPEFVEARTAIVQMIRAEQGSRARGIAKD
ncbi:ABC transporter ATP-binding protein [Actinomadura graeca]|uniref:ABC transporter ATP-binding protein n=2 Tax=Actinomadura graeca TaxID=2750812 RepID=A0ABX8R692_9ACTN|nr:ABC transporter ATP-binding protein [Actinomadura graeca]